MKKIFLIIAISFLFIPNVLADKCATKGDVDKKVNAKYYCYYNKTGAKTDNNEYNVIVGITSDYSNAYADIGRCDNTVGGPNTEPIANWGYNDSEWDSDLNSGFSAKTYYEKNKKCPEMAYIHYYPFEHVLYLIDGSQMKALRDTFSYNLAQDNEEKYYLVDFEESNDVKMSCSYSTNMKNNTASNSENYKVDFKLNFNEVGKIINANNIGTRITMSSEIGTGYNYVGDACPQLYICHVHGKTYTSGHGVAVSEYEYELYFADYSLDNRSDCKLILCTNEDSKYCDHTNSDMYICPMYADFEQELRNSFYEYRADTKNIDKINQYEGSKENIKSYCKSVMSALNVDNPCMTKCLGLKEQIENEFSLSSDDSSYKCGLSERLLIWLANIVKWVKYIIPVVVIVLGILDFIKAIGADKEDEIKKAQKKFITRLIAAALIFIVPLIIEFVLGKMGFDSNGCGVIDI